MDSTVLPLPSPPPVVVAPRAKDQLLTETNLFLPAFPKRKKIFLGSRVVESVLTSGWGERGKDSRNADPARRIYGAVRDLAGTRV